MEEVFSTMKVLIIGMVNLKVIPPIAWTGLKPGSAGGLKPGGVACYSSKNLTDWKFEGKVLPTVDDDPTSDLHPSQVIERPKVIYNEKTGKFVMWMHIESPDYEKAHAGVAVCDSPTGTFTYLGSFKPNGADSRDQTIFKDDDGKAYHICSSEWNSTLYISLLTDDYTKPSGTYVRRLSDNPGKLLRSLNETVIIICSHPVAPVGIRIKPNGLYPIQ